MTREVLPTLEKMENIRLTVGHFAASTQQRVRMTFQDKTVPLESSFCCI